MSIFWADDGLDTGPLLLQKSSPVLPNDTLDSYYNRFLYPEGVKALSEAVQMISAGKAPRNVQSEEGASYEPMLNKKELQKIDWSRCNTAKKLHNFIRGLDSAPGAWTVINEEEARLYGSSLWTGA